MNTFGLQPSLDLLGFFCDIFSDTCIKLHVLVVVLMAISLAVVKAATGNEVMKICHAKVFQGNALPLGWHDRPQMKWLFYKTLLDAF